MSQREGSLRVEQKEALGHMAEVPLSKDRLTTAKAGETKHLMHFVSDGVMVGRRTGPDIAKLETKCHGVDVGVRLRTAGVVVFWGVLLLQKRHS